MARHTKKLPVIVAAALVLAAGSVAAAPVNSDLAAAMLGGGCYPTGIQPALLDMLVLVNPEWAPIANGVVVDSAPVVIHGTVMEMHGDTSGDFPATHLRADVVHVLQLDPEDADRLATGNDGLMQTEWEAGAYPAWAWAGRGDRVVGLGRWIFDCGHTGAKPGNCSGTPSQPCVLDGDCRSPICATCGAMESCVGAHFGYSSELHPPYATAAIRTGRGGVIRRGPRARAVPATRVDIYVSPNAGGAGDRCVLTHLANASDLIGQNCFPVAQPIAPLNAQDFRFDVPLPPRRGPGKATYHLVTYPAPGGRAARVRVRPRLRGRVPHVEVTVEMAHRVRHELPTGFAGTLFAGWARDRTPMTHVRVSVDAVHINNALQLATPVASKTCSGSPADTACGVNADCPGGQTCQGRGPVKAWHLQAAVNGEWQELGGLENVSTGDTTPQTLVWDQYLPTSGGTIRLESNGVARECVDTMYGKALGVDLVELGFTKGLFCLNSTAHSAGTIDVTHPSSGFDASYSTTSSGGEGGHCSTNTGLLCVVNEDCPGGETCVTDGGAFSLQYRIAVVS